MPTPTPPVPEDQTPAIEPASPPDSPSSSTNRHNLVSLAAAGLLVSFFLPWISLLGAKLNGMDIQRNFSSYQLVWIMPLLAVITLVMNIAKLPIKSVSQLAGMSPFVILLYAANRLNANLSDFFKLLEYGAWVALVSGLVLAFTPYNTKKPSTSA